MARRNRNCLGEGRRWRSLSVRVLATNSKLAIWLRIEERIKRVGRLDGNLCLRGSNLGLGLRRRGLTSMLATGDAP